MVVSFFLRIFVAYLTNKENIMQQLLLEQKDITRLSVLTKTNSLVRVSHFHQSMETQKIGSVIDNDFVVIEYMKTSGAVYYLIKLVNTVLA